MLMQSHPSMNDAKHLKVLKKIMFGITAKEKWPKAINFH